jgi:hypothetical protein
VHKYLIVIEIAHPEKSFYMDRELKLEEKFKVIFEMIRKGRGRHAR